MSGVSRPIRTVGDGPLRLALPRGALFAGALDLLDAIGIGTSDLRGDSRALVFDAGEVILVTMRPSDVPTYVEAGAADLGITGKDVLAEQRDRAVYELLDLGFGACRMVLVLANNEKAGAALLADRGVYPNSDVRASIASKLTPADIKVVKFIDHPILEARGSPRCALSAAAPRRHPPRPSVP